MRKAVKDAPGVGLTEHRLGDGRTAVVAVNYDEFAVDCPLALDGTVERVWGGDLKDGVLRLDANSAAVFTIR